MQWIHSLQSFLRSSFMDLFFLGWNFVDTLPFSLILIILVWYLIDRRIGIKLFYILILSAAVGGTLKELFSLPRPCHVDPTVGLLCPTSFGLPSGAAQKAILLAGILFIECRKPVYRTLGVVFALFLCFSRIYLGVHYFTDILGGLFVGAILLIIYWKLFPKMEQIWKMAMFLFLGLLFTMGYFSSSLFWASLGIGIGLILAENEKREGYDLHFQILEVLIVFIGIAALYWGMIVFSRWDIFFALGSGLWMSYLGTFLAKTLRALLK